jgi:anion-transporting  ArsA/GET3 family ATPase
MNKNMQSVVVLGSGGVGKTTVAASLGLGLAKKENKGAIFTVDPSQRLCQTLGLTKLTLESSPLLGGKVEVYGLEVRDGLKKLLQKAIPEPERVEKILNHRLFRMIEGNISHLDHFLAMEKIVELLEREDLDFLVIDTPPHDQAFEFFESPQVLSKFLDKSFLKLLIEPKLSSDALIAKVINKAMDEGWKIFRSFLGENFWQELAILLKELMPLREKLLAASDKMTAFLKSPQTLAAVVTVPDRDPFQVAEKLVIDWEEKLQLRVKNMIFNKAFPMNVSLPNDLRGSVFFEKYELQKELMETDFFKSFEKVAAVNARSPSNIDLKILEEIGNGIIQILKP